MHTKKTDFLDVVIQQFITQVFPYLSKPLYQRAMYWLLTMDPKKPNIPNCRDYINFICDHSAAVQRIHLAITGDKMQLMDGNNRIHAILLCINYPHKVFPEHFKDVFKVIDRILPIDKDEVTSDANRELKDFFKRIDYKKIRGWTDAKNGFGTHIYQNIIYNF